MSQYSKASQSPAQAAAFQVKWNEDIKNGFFDLEPYISSSLQHFPYFRDFFTTNLRLDPWNHIPGLPARYAKQYNEERVMYLLNVPRSMTDERLHEILADFGDVEKLPSVVDVVSKETFRWVVMSKREEATRIHKMLKLIPITECNDLRIIAMTPCRPGRGLALDHHRERRSFEERPTDDSIPIHGEKVEEAIEELVEELENIQLAAETCGHTKSSSLNPEAAAFFSGMIAYQQDSRFPQYSTAFPNAFLRSMISNMGESSWEETIAPREDPNAQGTQPKVVEPLITMLMKAVARRTTYVERDAASLYNSRANRMNSNTSRDVAVEPTFSKVIARPVPRTQSTYVRPDTPEIPTGSTQSDQTMLTSIGGNEAVNGSVKGKGKATDFQRDSTDFPALLDSPKITPVAIAPTNASSWAAIANTGTSTKVIDIAPATLANSTNRLRIPSGGNPSKNEPLADQMRVVFILDIPTSLTYDDISNAVREGPIRSIHFGVDEDKNSRFCAIVFQYAKDAVLFVKALQKERVDSRPDRFRWVVDVARGEEPFPLDDVLRAMQAPTFATRRLTLVKASLFFMIGERQLRARIEKIIGEGMIQLIWLYNGGNATVVFSDVSHAISVKEEFDRYSATAGKPDGAPMAWAGLQTTFSKDPCVQPLDLKTAMHD